MSTLAEQPCYTLINIPSDAEPPTEMGLKSDLGMAIYIDIKHHEMQCACFTCSQSRISIFVM